MYWRVLAQPFVQDDWYILDLVGRNTLFGAIEGAFSPFGKVLYRPLSSLYFLGMYLAFGLATVPFHVIALILHAANTCFVIQIVRHLTGKSTLAFATGLLYALAVTVQVEPLLWLVGFYDIGGMSFLLLAFLLFMKGRQVLSLTAFVIALLIKESSFAVIGILFCYSLLYDNRHLRRLIPYVIVCSGYLLIKSLGVSPFTLGAEHPYKIQLLGEHIPRNLSLYGQWALDVVFPFGHWLPRSVQSVILLGLALMLIRKLWKNRSIGHPMSKPALFLLAWLVSGIVPVVFLSNHAFKSYLATSLIPLVALLLLSVDVVLPAFLRRCDRSLVILYVGIVGAVNWFALQEDFASTADQVRIHDGTNHLIKKAAIVSSVHAELVALYPRLDDSTIIVIDDANLGPIGGPIAPRLWYDNQTIDVMDPHEYDSLSSGNTLSPSRAVVVLYMSQERQLPHGE